MCGIFGYVGKSTDVGQMVLEGLKTLEYRGYDSWGIAVKENGKIKTQKNIGKIGNPVLHFSESNIGIGHTRWATHGGVTIENAHPHLDCSGQIAVLHNGIVENYQEIKKDLIDKGHKFISETDTEVLPHLIEENLKKGGFTTSVRDTFNQIKGLNAIVVLNAVSSEIIAAKNGSPLVVGKGKDGFYVSSDSLGIIKHTRELLFLKDNEMIVLGKALKLLKLPGGERIEPKFEKVDWKIEEAEIGKFDHFMIKEIFDQPKVIREIAAGASEIETLSNLIKKAKGTFFIGAGTAYYACLAGSYLFSKVAKRHVNTTPASEFNYLEDFLTSESLVVALSQSGETIDVVEPFTRAKEKGATTVALTNVLGSTLYRMSDYKMLLNAGPEKAVASTKAYIAKISALLLLVYSITGNLEEGKKILMGTADEIDDILKKTEEIKKLAQLVSNSSDIYVLGRGISYPSALEAALKIKEVSYIHSEGLAGGELKHGSIALISKGTPCFVFAPNDETYEAILSNAAEIKARGGTVIGISHKNASVFDHFIQVSDTKEGSIISQIVPMQILAYYLAVIKKYDPDKPRNLAKSVTVK